MRKLKLHGFNNLTKTLSFNIYDIAYAASSAHRREYIEYIDEVYKAKRLRHILTDVAEIIGASILNVAHQDYDPQGASVTMLIAEEPIASEELSNTMSPGPLPDSVVAHLDKSHITVHTYPESHPDKGISTFRADIDVSTCGRVSPLKALNYLIHSFESEALHRPPHQLHPELHRSRYPRPLRDDRRQCLPGEHLPHQDDAEAVRHRGLPVRRRQG